MVHDTDFVVVWKLHHVLHTWVQDDKSLLACLFQNVGVRADTAHICCSVNLR